MTAAVEWGRILEVAWVSLSAGVATMTLFSLVVYSSSRAAEAHRAGASPAGYGAVAALLLAAFLGLVVLGLVIILNT